MAKAIVVGVGAEHGLGAALCRKFAAEGLHVLVAGRTPSKIARVAESISANGGTATPVRTDATVETDVVDGLLNIDAIAETYWQLHRQHRTAWSHEVDLRPYAEPF